jgi:16S rRNA (guanine527-N7)-methyltransferase
VAAALDRSLQAGLEELGLSQPGLGERLLGYLALLVKWNRAFNLSAVREPQEMVPRHLLDSLAILPWVQGERLLDVGSGAGLPGIPLAIARPELRVVLLDSNGKKTRFLRQAQLELGLANVEVIEGRVEAYVPPTPFDIITSRAFAQLKAFIDLTAPLLAPSGRWLAMKGRLDENELTELGVETVKLQVHRLTVPGLDADRHLIEIRRNGL